MYICSVQISITMASINFLYRSKKNEAPLNLRLLFRVNNTSYEKGYKDFIIGAKTKLEVSKKYWEKQHYLKRPKDIEIYNKQVEVNQELNRITKHILNAFKKINSKEVTKDWLQLQVDYYYDPPTEKEALPKELIKYIDRYIEFKQNELSTTSIRKVNVTKHKLQRFEAERGKTILINEINPDFKLEFENYCLSENYAPNTITREIRFIKTICYDAKYKGLETHPQLDGIKAKYTKVENIYLTDKDLNNIENVFLPHSYLENVRDWLLISCYTGQRISDFMRFTKKMIRYEKNKEGILKPLIEFTQKKTGKLMTVPLHPKVMDILSKRNGNFPKPISDQKYNDYIKEVCLLAGLTKKVKGSKKVKISDATYRKVTGTFKKWELVTSHIGRRTFATLNYGKIPTSFLIYVTGHSSEALFLSYIGKSNKDIAMELTAYF